MARRGFRIAPLLFSLVLVVLGFVVFKLIQPHRETRNPSHKHEPSQGRWEAEPRESRRPRREIPPSCGELATTCGSDYFHRWNPPGDRSCSVRMRHGYPEPDPRCTPGGVNPSVTAPVLTDPGWRTKCVRNCETSEAQKHVAYAWYGIRKPEINSGDNQVCELDHLVPLELGGADGLGNVWPECGPDSETLHRRYFKIKDRVENYLADEVRAGKMPLAEAQRGIAEDWTQYLDLANQYCEHGGRC